MKNQMAELTRHGLGIILAISLLFGGASKAFAQYYPNPYPETTAEYNVPYGSHVTPEGPATMPAVAVPVSGYDMTLPSAAPADSPAAPATPATPVIPAAPVAPMAPAAPATPTVDLGLPTLSEPDATAPVTAAPAVTTPAVTAPVTAAPAVTAPAIPGIPAPSPNAAPAASGIPTISGTPASVLQPQTVPAPSVPAPSAPVQAAPEAITAPITTSAPSATAPSVTTPTYDEAITEVPASVYAQYNENRDTAEVSQTSGAEMTAMRNGMVTTPGYPRNHFDSATPEAAASPEFSKEYPKTKEEMVSERVGQVPPLKPHPQQEAYSYFTESSTSASTVCQKCGEGYGNPYLWMFEVSANVKHRERESNSGVIARDLSYDSSTGNTTVSQSITTNTGFPVALGLETSLTRYMGRNSHNYDIWADFRADILHKWSASENFLATSYFESEYNIPGLNTLNYTYVPEGETEPVDCYSLSQTLHYDYDSWMNSAELIFRFRERGRLDPMICNPNGRWTRECQGGLRYTHLLGVHFTSYNEDLNWYGIGNQYAEGNLISYADYAGKVQIETRNSLLGFSLGGEMLDKHCVWSWGANWRFTPALNFVKTSLLRATTYNDFSHQVTKRITDVAFLGELGLFVQYKIWPHCILRVSYDVSYIGNLALASHNNNLGINGEIQTDTGSGVLFQSLTMGCTFVW